VANGATNLAGYVDTINYSGGSNQNGILGVSILDRHMDNIVRGYADNMVCAAGNSGPGGYVISPAQAYNVIAVGAIDDNNTNSFADDTMATYSSFVDPISLYGDREKPEVVAPGTNINSLIGGGLGFGDVGSGISYAAPMVSGICALMGERKSTVNGWPEAVKAIIMATAWRNIEGASRLSDQDGAGHVDAFKAMLTGYNGPFPVGFQPPGVVNRGWGAVGSGTCTPAFFTETYSMRTLVEPYLQAGQRLRVVIAWDTNTGYANYTTEPSVDLDLWLYRNSTGTWVASSSSFDNTYEIIEYIVPATGRYAIKARDMGFNESGTFLGWGWYAL
jgi:hypothetical protein